MVSDEVLRAMCRALIENRDGKGASWLDAIVSELLARKLINPKTPLEDQDNEAREFAQAFLAE